MDIIDLALQFKDFEWAKELLDEKDPEKEPVDFDQFVTLFDKASIALDNLITQYAIKEENGIRSFNINSNYDRNEADLIIVEKPPYHIGDTVKYYVPSNDELIYMRGTVNGYYMGYRDAYRAVNNDYALLFSTFNKPPATKSKNKKKVKETGKTVNKGSRKESDTDSTK